MSFNSDSIIEDFKSFKSLKERKTILMTEGNFYLF